MKFPWSKKEPLLCPPLDEKPTHSAFLILVLNFFLVLNILMATSIAMAHMQARNFLAQILLLIPIMNIVCAISIIKFKRWGFYVLVLIAFFMMGLHIYAKHSIISCISALLWVVLIFIGLQLGKENKSWKKMK